MGHEIKIQDIEHMVIMNHGSVILIQLDVYSTLEPSEVALNRSRVPHLLLDIRQERIIRHMAERRSAVDGLDRTHVSILTEIPEFRTGTYSILCGAHNSKRDSWANLPDAVKAGVYQSCCTLIGVE